MVSVQHRVSLWVKGWCASLSDVCVFHSLLQDLEESDYILETQGVYDTTDS